MTGTWRNAEKEFPRDGVPVLCVTESKKGIRIIRIGNHWIANSRHGGQWYTNSPCTNVIMWMTLPEIPEGEIPKRYTVQDAEGELKDCVNELCLQCGSYKQEHEGACDGCRWLKIRRGW